MLARTSSPAQQVLWRQVTAALLPGLRCPRQTSPDLPRLLCSGGAHDSSGEEGRGGEGWLLSGGSPQGAGGQPPSRPTLSTNRRPFQKVAGPEGGGARAGGGGRQRARVRHGYGQHPAGLISPGPSARQPGPDARAVQAGSPGRILKQTPRAAVPHTAQSGLLCVAVGR